ncbi:MAG: helix-turn-helix domain-containing protein [Clostridiales bacterium]|nr:helix-turn-helix domain-containing protein [Clostridiales bacterium]
MKLKNTFFTTKNGTTMHRFFLMLFVPVLLILLFAFISSTYYTNQYRSVLTSAYTNELNKFLRYSEDEISNLSAYASVLMSNQDTKYVSESEQNANQLDRDITRRVQTTLQTINSRLQYLDNIAIVNRSSGFVVSTSGVYDMAHYFNDIYKYDNYDLDFWVSYNTGNGMSKYLDSSPAWYTTDKASHPVVPAVFPVGSKRNSLIIFNINAKNIFENFRTYKFTDNSCLYMIDNHTGEVITVDRDNAGSINMSLIKKQYESNYYFTGDTKINRKKHFIISSQPRSNIFGYTYIAAVPYSDIERYIHKTMISLIVICVILLLLMLLYAYFGSAILIKPWKSIAKNLQRSSPQSKKHNDIISYVNDTVSSLLNENIDLTRNLAVSLSHAQEKYLVDILNDPTTCLDEQMNKMIFKHDYFVSVAVNISQKSASSDKYVVLDVPLYTEIYRAIEAVFASSFLTFSLPNTKNTLYLILNIESEDGSELNLTIEHIKKLFAADEEYIDVFVGMGDIYKGIDGLRQSHKEALFDIFNTMNKNKVQMLDSTSFKNYSSNIYNENILINYMLTGHGESASELIKDIFASCAKNPPQSRANIYAGIFNAFSKVIEIKKFRIPDFKAKTESELLNDITTTDSDNSILHYILELTENITTFDNASGHKLSNIAEYIQEHYTEDLYLDNLAETFNTTPKYMSKAIKQQIGTSFKQYLTQLRIGKAKELLISDDVKIADVGVMSGFTNHSSFVRAFKQKTGISPSEYRSLYKEGKIKS